MKRSTWALLFAIGLCLGFLTHEAWGQQSPPSIVIPANFDDRWFVCAVYPNRPTTCDYAGNVRQFLARPR